MLEQTTWVRVNSQCHTLVDDDARLIACLTTSYDEDDGDDNFIWDVEIEGDDVGSFTSLYQAKLFVQRAIADFERRQAEADKAQQKRKTTTKKKATTKKS